MIDIKDVEYLISRPGGNDTVIVITEVPRSRQPSLGKELLQANPQAEQVAFMERGGRHAQMAGGEFCCNAARAFGYYLTGGQEGNAEFTMSGTRGMIQVQTKKGSSKAFIPLNLPIANTVSEVDKAAYLVRMGGIMHLVVIQDSPLFRGDAGTGYADSLLERFSLKSHPAAGIIFFDRDNGITPYVFVRDLNMMYAETACGSGSLACAMGASFLNGGRPVDAIEIRQPSGINLTVSISTGGGSFLEGSVDGPVEIIQKPVRNGLR